MKKVLSILLSLMLIMSIGQVVFASDGDPAPEQPTKITEIQIKKTYTTVNEAQRHQKRITPLRLYL